MLFSGKELEVYNMFSKIKTRGGSVDICLNQDLEKFLVKDEYLKENGYSIIEANLFNNLNSFYSMRLYEIVISFNNINSIKLELDDLKKMLGIEKKYTKFNDFKKRILDPALKDINKNTKVSINYELIKNGRKYNCIKFIKKHKRNFKLPSNKIKPPVIEHKIELTKVEEKLENTLEDICNKFKSIAPKYYLDKLLMRKLLQDVGEELVYKYLHSWQKYMSIKSMKNPAKFFYMCIKNNVNIWEELNTKHHDAPNSVYHGKPIQSTNFDQREYDDDFFESLYDNFK
jgi:plasmid replication initiation protein